jgi:dipeptidyl aminopeptidase/acylaminoacyl peptidase
VDLVKGFNHLISNHSFIDSDKAVALGASYGGYMINWIQGNDLGRKFKALVCHNGIFSTLNQISTEELYFIDHDFNGYFWEESSAYAIWNPAQPKLIKNWATPELIIHSNKDYRIPISEGLAAFNVLQLRGVPSKFVTFEGENHWVLNPENSLIWHREVISWICKWTGVEYDDKSFKLDGPFPPTEAVRIILQQPSEHFRETV